MISLDTNVLVRLVTADDARQAAAARGLLEDCLDRGEQCLVSVIAVCELEWVLDSVYRASRREIGASVRRLLTESPFVVEDRRQVERALERYDKGRGDLSDYLMGARAEAQGARTTYSFDRALRTAEGFTLL